jgi:diguanylate cyclase (GGDEF)-like protein
VREGDYTRHVDVEHKDEIGQLAVSFNHMLDGIVSREKEILRLAYEDGLTGLPNRAMFHEQLGQAVRMAKRGTGALAVLLFDMDRFKTINDTLGHPTGDQALREVGMRVRNALRDSDIIARLGGDEFAVLLTLVADTAAAHAVARRITDALARPATVGGLPVVCQASVGLATAASPDEYGQLLGHADTALYAAKADGKGRFRSYDTSMQSPLHRGSGLRVELERALRGDAGSNDGLTLHYQPIVALDGGAVRGFEALTRWEHPVRGSVPVPNLIDIAEQTGLIVPLGKWALARALADSPALGGYVAVNVSATQLRQPGFVAHIRDALTSAGVDRGRLVVELTERQPLAYDDHIWDDLGELREAGIRVAIDDYGTGYASLGYLRHPVIDIVKLDRTLLTDIGAERTRMLVRAVIDLTGKLGIELIAEGIEDEATRSALVELGCRYGQGHLFAPALPLAEASEF